MNGDSERTLDHALTTKTSRRTLLKAGVAVAGAVYAPPAIETIFGGMPVALATGPNTQNCTQKGIISLPGCPNQQCSVGANYVPVPSTGPCSGATALLQADLTGALAFHVTGTIDAGGITVSPLNPTPVISFQVPASPPCPAVTICKIQILAPYGAGSVNNPDGSVTVYPDASGNFGLTFFFSVPAPLTSCGIQSFQFFVGMLYSSGGVKYCQLIDPSTSGGQARSAAAPGSTLASGGIRISVTG